MSIHRPPWPRVLSGGRWIEVTPGWIADRLETGLTPSDVEIIALAAQRIGLTVEQLHTCLLYTSPSPRD